MIYKSALNNFSQKILDNFWKSIALIVFLRLILAYLFPITSDEAYFYLWGKNLAPAYYDHSFMTGLWVRFGLIFGDHIIFSRALTILTQTFVALCCLGILKKFGYSIEKAKLIGIALLLSPIHFLFVLTVTDSPLYLFSFLAGASFLLGLKKDSLIAFLLSGVFLGLGIFSKYLVVFWGFAMALTLLSAVLYSSRKKRIALYAIAGLAGLAPFSIANFLLAQNYCWWPIQFNLANRTNDKGLDLTFVILFFVYQILLFTPWVFKVWWSDRKEWMQNLKKNNFAAGTLFLFGLICLGMFSILDSGLHYALSFYPFLYLSLIDLQVERLKRIVFYSAATCTVLFLILVSVLLIQPEAFKHNPNYRDYVMGRYGDEIHAEVLKFANKNNAKVFGTFAYSTAAEMEYHAGVHYLVFGNHGKHGRNDDIWTNFAELNEQNIVLIGMAKLSTSKVNELKSLFADLTLSEVEVRGATYTIAIGQKFNFMQYKQTHLAKIRDEYYQFHPALPLGKCIFTERYFGEVK